jgi:hypothetical protein
VVRKPKVSTLALLVARVFADDADDALTPNQLALVANSLDAGPHFHWRTGVKKTTPPGAADKRK